VQCRSRPDVDEEDEEYLYYEDEEEVEGEEAKLQNAASTRAPSTRSKPLYKTKSQNKNVLRVDKARHPGEMDETRMYPAPFLFWDFVLYSGLEWRFFFDFV
jgi:hypothetical protein